MDERIIKYFQGKLPEDNRIKLLREVQLNASLKKEISEYQNTLAILNLSPEAINLKEGTEKHKLLVKKIQKKKTRLLLERTSSYAATVCILIATTWIIATTTHKNTLMATTEQELFVPAGQRARITLPDGTVAWLNSGSTLKYPSIFGKERKIVLDGEGYFKVAQDVKHPFIISTSVVDIKALGTEFNVFGYSQSDFMETTLINGSIKIYHPGMEKNGVILLPNQQYYRHRNGECKVKTQFDKERLLWKDGIYSFRKAHLSTIIEHLELFYNVEIKVKDPEILRYEYTGKFRQKDGAMEILRIIQRIHKFKICKDDETNLIILSK